MQKWTRVQYKDLKEDVQVQQMWKKEGTNLVSEYNGALFGIHEIGGLAAFLDANKMTAPIAIDEEATSNFELSLPGEDNFYMPNEARGMSRKELF